MNESLDALRESLFLLSRLLGRDVPLTEALQVAEGSSRSLRVRELLASMRAAFERDQNILPPMEEAVALVPRTVYFLTAAGFVSGQLSVTWELSCRLLDCLRESLPASGTPKGLFARQAQFAQSLALLLKGDVHIVNALEALAADALDPALRGAVEKMLLAVREGHSLVPTVAEHASLFSAELAKAVSEGEADGTLSDRLMSFSQKLRDQLRRA